MKDKSKGIKLLELLTLIAVYYIFGKESLFLYAITLSLYNIYSSCFLHITLKETFKNIQTNSNKFKLLKYIILYVAIICSLFILLSIFISDIMNISLNIENIFWPYLVMSLSVLFEPLLKLLLEYLESYGKPKLSNRLLNMYYILEMFLFVVISILTIRIFKVPIEISISLLYLSKIISFLVVATILFLIIKKMNLTSDKKVAQEKIDFRKTTKEILTNNSQKSIISIVKNSYYYISIILLYMVLSTRYRYNIDVIERDLTFVYLYGIYIITFIVDILLPLLKANDKKDNIVNYVYQIFQNTMTITIIMAITSPLFCRILFGSYQDSIYLMMLSFMLMPIALFESTFANLKNKKIMYISLFAGIISKLILDIPLINSFYRMGYNLVYGDVISTIIGMFISVIINYIYIKAKRPKEKTLERILTTLYENILLCIILVLLQFIIPIKPDHYLKALLQLVLYISISLVFIKLKKKRG